MGCYPTLLGRSIPRRQKPSCHHNLSPGTTIYGNGCNSALALALAQASSVSPFYPLFCLSLAARPHPPFRLRVCVSHSLPLLPQLAGPHVSQKANKSVWR
ncbi:hypothetical protein CGRA01v4_13447 [Colletotrichum graminicola]|nr:hypothetical protein CGRA01v4_13447 [Colletotrichum graminicola]